ncbi:hypothetical protein CL634_10595 [bacterium]|nr:hypothetical protein [bacterium]|tara:strand:- start:321 stop:689 length:369 start_codon:yes stop_codon:yes gene_type:complete
MNTTVSGATNLSYKELIISSGNTISSELALGSETLVGITTPSTLDGTNKRVHIEQAIKGAWYPVKGAESDDHYYIYIKNGNAMINPLIPGVFCFLDNIRVVAETTQTSDRKFTLIFTRLRSL